MVELLKEEIELLLLFNANYIAKNETVNESWGWNGVDFYSIKPNKVNFLKRKTWTSIESYHTAYLTNKEYFMWVMPGTCYEIDKEKNIAIEIE